MGKQKSKRLSLLLGLYLLVSIIGFSIGVLSWSYYSTIQTINITLEESFEQKHTLAEIFMEQQLKFIEQVLGRVRRNDLFLLYTSLDDQSETGKVMYDILDSYPEQQLDVLFFSSEKKSLSSDVSSPFFETELVLPEILKKKNELLSTGQILRFKTQSNDLTIMLKAASIIQKETGRVLGTLFGGIVLNDNLSLLEGIKRATKSEAIIFLESGELIGSSDLLESETTQTLLRAAESKKEMVQTENGLLIHHKKLLLVDQPTSLDVATAVTDQILVDLQQSYWSTVSISLIISLLFLLFTTYLIRKVSFPSLENLLKYAADVSSGNLQAHYQDGKITEFNQLGRAFERMVSNIRDEIEERRFAEAGRARLTTILETTSDLVSMAMPNGKIIYMNSSGKQMLGWLGYEDFTEEKKISDVHPNWALDIIENDGLPAAIKHGLWEGETAVIDISGNEVPVSQLIMSHKSSDGELEYLSTIMRDLTERKRAENISNEAKLLAQEMELARTIQTSLLPDAVTNIHLDFVVEASMITADQVGGDYYDITFDREHGLWISIGDVSGHGVKPGLIMMMAQTVHTTVTASLDCEARDVVIMINDILYRNVNSRLKEKDFMTFNVLKYLGEGKFEHAGAHLRIIVYRQKWDEFELIRTRGVYLNLKEDISKATKNSYFEMNPGDIMVLYTDGLTEARNPEGELLDMDRFLKIIKLYVHKNPEVMKEHIMTDVLTWCDNKRDDDMTLVIVKKKEI